MAFFGNDPRCQLFFFLGEYVTILIFLYELSCILLRPKFGNRSLHLRIRDGTSTRGPCPKDLGSQQDHERLLPILPHTSFIAVTGSSVPQLPRTQHSTLHSASSRPRGGCRGLSHLVGASHIYDITRCEVSF